MPFIRSVGVLQAVALFGSMVVANSAIAGFLVTNSSFNVGTVNSSDAASTATIAANGRIYNFLLTNANNTPAFATATESALPNGASLISIRITANRNIFPDTGTGQDFGYFNVGFEGNPMKFVQSVDLTSAILTFRTASGGAYGPGEFVGLVANPSNWDGYFISTNYFAGYYPVHAADVREISLDLTVIPAPGTSLFAVAGMLASLRRRQGAP